MKIYTPSFLLMIVPWPLFAITADFSRNLSVGMRGDDVRMMQIILNADPDTAILGSGAGSPGNETTYFGSATKHALEKFQEKYRDEILAPSGFSRGTGFFGEKTRAKFVSLQKKFDDRHSIPTASSHIAPTLTQSAAPSLSSTKASAMFPLIDAKDFNVTADGAPTSGEFYNRYAKLTARIGFSQEELGSMMRKKVKANEKGEMTDRIMVAEELMDLSVNGDDSQKIRDSFMAWARLDRNMVAELKKMPIAPLAINANQEIASWFQYHGNIAERFGSGLLNTQEKSDLLQEFRARSVIHMGLYGRSIARAEKKEPQFFTVIKTAEASGCGLTQFGGRVGFPLYCNFGIVEPVIGTCGGSIFFSWAVQAANPYLYHNIYLPGAAVMGKSVMVPFVCPLGIPPFAVYFPFTDIAIYYGTSLLIAI